MLGRFTTQDAFAEKYPALSPYQYGANNPIANIDVNGDSIVTTLTTQRDGKTVNIDYTYRADENGIYGFFDSEGNQYTGDGYISELSDALSTLREGKTGKSLVDYLATSSKTVRIRDLRSSETGNAADGKGEYVKWSPSKTEGGLDEKGNTGRPPFVGLGHELAHIQDVWKGTVDNGVWLDSEKYNINMCIANGLMKGDTKEMFKDTGYNKAQSRKHEFLDVATMRRLYDFWKAGEAKDKDGNELFLGREKHAIFRDLGLFLFMYLGDGQNLADTLRLTYDELYYATHGKQLRFLRHKTRERNESASEVIFPVTPEIQEILRDIQKIDN